ncbi:zinc finger HIT domain-containing protein 2 isoform X2 [Cryptotermes secundus]|uniref:zinc finger HIT domain-containing protein 2 isoform X2 n=1 Tax=Cryptotermes secundus TaxID=105785 RepID=UPI000CD7AE22|nr:zinc finger HIT domain-containing protein 2 isoform X2 [Cryptotermes secundus]
MIRMISNPAEKSTRCLKTKGIYICPRCNILYCSLPCYQSELHVNCSEAFYRDCVIEEVKSRETDSHSGRKMNEILQRLQENEDNSDIDSDDGDSIPDLHERLRNVDLDDADSIWEKLTLAERQEFENLLQSGDASQLVALWEPWWLYRKQKILVQDLKMEQDTLHPAYEANCPTVNKNVPPFFKISKTPPAPCVKYNILNVLGAYCYTVRFLNGEHHNMPAEACSILVNLSANLSLNHTYNSAVIAVEAVAHEAINCTWMGASHHCVICMKNDIECILAGPEDSNYSFYLQASLSDIYQLLSEARHSKNTDPNGVKKSGEFTKRFSDNLSTSLVQKDKLRLIIKKLEYYLSWSQDHASEICCQKLQVELNF